jgi:hypothetical protein
MHGPLIPFAPPPTPPELAVLARTFKREHTQWSERNVLWVEMLIRELRRALAEFRLQFTRLAAHVDEDDTRAKDVYTFRSTGAVAIGLVNLSLRAVANSTLIEVFAAVEVAPTGSDLTIACLLNSVNVGTLVIRAGTLTGAVALEVALTKDTSILQPQILQVGLTTPGSNLVVQYRAR